MKFVSAMVVPALFVMATLPHVGRGDDPPNELPSYERAASDAERAHWAFQPLRRPQSPAVKDPARVRNPIDAFVLTKLEAAGLAPSPPADRRTLLRRVCLDLIGLPPTPDEQRAFLADESPDAFAKVVDDLLARPQYGERWARHWLDVVRYAETNGYERDGAKPNAWRYRDWAIDAFNHDKPFDRFLTEQIAGDEIADSNAESQIATTFLRLGTWDDEPADPVPDRYEQLDDVLGTTATAFLGLTLRCARCHNHKFEPFSQGDYYRVLAAFEPLKRPETVVSATHRKEHEVHVGTQSELAAYRDATAKIDATVAERQKQIDAIKAAVRERLFAAGSQAGSRESGVGNRASESRPPSLFPTADSLLPTPSASEQTDDPEPKRTSLPPDAIAAFRTEAAKQTPEQKSLVKKHTESLEKEIREAATDAERTDRERLEKEIDAENATRPKEPPRAHIWIEDTRETPPTNVNRRGDPRSALGEVTFGLPTILASGRNLEPPQPTATTTGRRLWLARWMTGKAVGSRELAVGSEEGSQNSGAAGLVARVFVNRVWQWHFGDGLVASENDFGVMGERPSHPELLDWLASEFIASGWRVKALHRLIVLSSVYQQASGKAVGNRQLTVGDKELDSKPPLLLPTAYSLLPSFPQRRADAEVVRDSILAASGQLNLERSGPSVYPTLPRAVLEGQSRPGEGWGKSDERAASRRSIYIFVKRVLAVPELEILDAPDNTSSCEQRPVSTVAPQALTFLNGDFANQQARHFAERLARDAGAEPAAQIDRAFELALCRPPRPQELQAALDFLAAQQRQIESDAKTSNKVAGDPARRALESFCLVLFNLNEFVYVD